MWKCSHLFVLSTHRKDLCTWNLVKNYLWEEMKGVLWVWDFRCSFLKITSHFSPSVSEGFTTHLQKAIRGWGEGLPVSPAEWLCNEFFLSSNIIVRLCPTWEIGFTSTTYLVIVSSAKGDYSLWKRCKGDCSFWKRSFQVSVLPKFLKITLT